MELIDRIRKRIEQTASEAHAYAPITRVISEAEVKEILEQEGKKGGWIPCSERMPECCGYPVLLTVENRFGQRFVCKAFTNYMKEGTLLFYTNEKEYCEELTSSKLSDVWKPIAWMHLPEPYEVVQMQKNECIEKLETHTGRIRSIADEEQGNLLVLPCQTVWFICDKGTEYATVMSESIDNLTVYEIRKIDQDGRYWSNKEAAEAKVKEMAGNYGE